MKLNKAEKFVKRQFELGKTRNGVRVAIADKLGHWNFPPEYQEALAKFYPLSYLDDCICDQCGSCHETCFCGDEYDSDADAQELCEEMDIDSIRKDIFYGLGQSAEAERAVFGNKALQHEDCLLCQKNPCICNTINLNVLPKPGSRKWDNMVDYMRADIESGMAYTKVEMLAREIVENSIRCNDCDAVTHKDENSTGYCEKCGSANVRPRDFDEEVANYMKTKNK